MIPANIAFKRVIETGLTALKNSADLWNNYFADEIEHGSAGDVARWRTHFLAHYPRVERAYPRRTVQTWPFIAVVIMADMDDKRFVGHLADRDEDEERVGVLEEAKIGVYFYSENLDELDYLHLIVKKIIRGSFVAFSGLGIATVEYENGADIQPNELIPETVFVRAQTWAAKGLESTVVNLASVVRNVYVHSAKATFTAGDDTLAGEVDAE